MKRQLGLLEMVRRRTARASRRATRGAFGLWAWSSEGDSPSSKRWGRETRAERGHARRGSTLLIVLALLGMLLLLGMLYFTFASQEQANATYFAEAAKHIDDPGDDIDAIFDAALKELIQGADQSQKNSVISYRHSLIGTFLGKDLQPFSGTGVYVVQTGAGLVALNADGTAYSPPAPAAGYDLLEPNDSAAARYNPGSQLFFERDFALLPASDVDYTYPDINNMFLAYKSYVWDPSVAGARRLVLKPTFHRPELLRDNSQNPVPNWATNAAARARLMRPHPDHYYVWRQNNSAPAERRFLNDYDPADAGIISGLSCLRGFPFHNVPPAVGAGSGPVPVTPSPRTQGVWSLTGPGGANIPYQYDSDNDGDGINEGIWLDLDLPVQVRPSDGKTYVPMISFTVYDLDSLLNLNIHSNLSGDSVTKGSPTTDFGTTLDISRSCMGLGPNEVNLLHALNAVPGVDVTAANLADHLKYFGHNPSVQRELANMELWWLLTGRIQWPTAPSTAPPQIHAGRHGEANRLWRVLQTAGAGAVIAVNQYGAQGDYFPFAGFTYTDENNRDGGDDNRDENEGRESWLGGSSTGVTQPFVHPLALGGRGRFWGGLPSDPPGSLKQFRKSLGGLTGSPLRWQAYDGMGIGYDRTNNLNNADLLTYLSGTLMTNTSFGANYKNPNLGPNEQLVHDTLETTLEPKSQLRPYDEPYESIESIWLHMSTGDRTASGLTSRLGNVMPANLVSSTTLDPNLPHEIGQRFTVDSWDVKQFALMNAPDPATVATTPRAWEWNVDFDSDGRREFPPQYDPVLPAQATQQNPAYVPALDSSKPIVRLHNAFGPNDPFRPQLRRLLSTEYGDTTGIGHPMRLSINEFLDVERKPNVTGNPFSSPLQYRPLTPHLTSVPTTPITALPRPIAATPAGAFDPIYTLPPFPPAPYTDSLGNTFTQDAVREFWARRDRQQMARDIYVMLYTFCGGNDDPTTGNVTTPTAAGVTVHNAKVKRQMAQFAVNLVDALDRDNVITAFEFDLNLAGTNPTTSPPNNGWNLDDDPSTVNAAEAALPPGERGVVYGVEAQELTFSETLWLWQKKVTGATPDHPRTPFDETLGDYNFFQIELRATSPKNVPLATTGSTTATTGVWRIAMDDTNDGTDENRLVLQNGNATMTAGSLFTIAAADTSPVGTASLYVDYTGGTDFELIAPNVAGAAYNGAPMQPVADLDLLHASQSSRFTLTNGAFMSYTNSPATRGSTTPDTTNLRLERRLNPYLPQLPLADNPFVPVDVTKVDRKDLGISTTATNPVTTQADVAARISGMAPHTPAQVCSTIRKDPMMARNTANGTSVGPAPHINSIGQENASPTPTYKLPLVHFDRDFASVIELFEVPLFGPGALTRLTNWSRLAPSKAGGTQNGQLEFGGPFTFGAAVLLQEEDIDHDSVTPPETEDANGNGLLDLGEDGLNGLPINEMLDVEDINGNGVLDSHPYHFHRLLSLIEVPTRTHRQLGDPLKINRIPGKVNLNNLRDRHVLAALIDDRDVITIEEDSNHNQIVDAGEDLNGDQQLGLQDLSGEAARDWWNSFLIARDGTDPITQLPLPRTGSSRPFRDLANLTARTLTPNASPLEDTILRRLPATISPAGRGLFELATEAEYTQPPNSVIDPMIRHRLLSKIIGNTTTRSNAFVVFATIGMFECYENPTTGAVRIGGQMDVDGDLTPDTHRAVFIIDRSSAEDAFDKGSGTFDWKKLILAKQRVN